MTDGRVVKVHAELYVNGIAGGGLCLPQGMMATACGRLLPAKVVARRTRARKNGKPARWSKPLTCKSCRRFNGMP